MSRFRVITQLIALGLIALALAELSRERHRKAARIPPKTPAFLARPVGLVRFQGKKFADAVNALSRASGVRIDVDPAGEKIASQTDLGPMDPASNTTLALATPGAFTFTGRNLDDDLRALTDRSFWGVRFMIQPIPVAGLTYFVEGDHIRITTLAAAPKPPTTVRIYDVRDIVRSVRSQSQILVEPPFVGWKMPATQPWTGHAPSEAEAMGMIRRWIAEWSQEEEQFQMGSGIADCQGDNGFLYVLDTAEGHRKIAQLFEALRRADQFRWGDKTREALEHTH